MQKGQGDKNKHFISKLSKLVNNSEYGPEMTDRIATARKYLDKLEKSYQNSQMGENSAPKIKIIPCNLEEQLFDEDFGKPSITSENVGLISTMSIRGQTDELLLEGMTVWIAYNLSEVELLPIEDVHVTMSLSYKLPDEETIIPIPGLQDMPVEPKSEELSTYPLRLLKDDSFDSIQSTHFIATLPEGQLILPSNSEDESGWKWEDIDERFRELTLDGNDPFTFAHQFNQEIIVELKLHNNGTVLSSDSTKVTYFDISRSCSWLYRRFLEDLIWLDTEKQAMAHGIEDLDYHYHPFYPLLILGMEKAKLYMHAIQQQLKEKYHYRFEPLWLLQVGNYLELLTCLGIFEAVKNMYPDLITTEEQYALDNYPKFKKLREAINYKEWEKVWKYREIVFPTLEMERAGPVSIRNLLKKKKAIKAFLKAHHADLLKAIELTGKNPFHFQETFQRVFRDCERAVIRNSNLVFPETQALPDPVKKYIFWHHQGPSLFGLAVLPKWTTAIFGAEDGVFPASSRMYRKSMNHVAKIAKQQKLVDYTGEECVPKEASLIESHLEDNRLRVVSLLKIDGLLESRADAETALFNEGSKMGEETTKLLKEMTVFQFLNKEDINYLSNDLNMVEFEENERMIIQGEKPYALYIIKSGAADVYYRGDKGEDVKIDELGAKNVIGLEAILKGGAHRVTVQCTKPIIALMFPASTLLSLLKRNPVFAFRLASLTIKRLRKRTNIWGIIKKLFFFLNWS